MSEPTYFVTDIESSGFRPGQNSMLSFATVAVTGGGGEWGRFEAVLAELPGATWDPGTRAWFERDEPEAVGLLALMVLTEARRAARAADGELVQLRDQDRQLWDPALIDEGHDLVRACLRRNHPGPYQIQAAINAVHTDAPQAADTDWRQVVQLYDQLMQIAPSPVVAMNRAIAIAELDGPDVGLAALEELALDHYQPYRSTRADLLRRAGRRADAIAEYDRTLELTTNHAERRFLERRLAELA